MSSGLTDAGIFERIDANIERIANGVEDMAKSLKVIALRFAPRPNQSPKWVDDPYIEFVEGEPRVVLLSTMVQDPDPEYPGAKPLEIDAQAVLASLAGMGITVVDLGRDVEVRYDGRVLGATPQAPVTVDNAMVAVADDGVAGSTPDVSGG